MGRPSVIKYKASGFGSNDLTKINAFSRFVPPVGLNRVTFFKPELIELTSEDLSH